MLQPSRALEQKAKHQNLENAEAVVEVGKGVGKVERRNVAQEVEVDRLVQEVQGNENVATSTLRCHSGEDLSSCSSWLVLAVKNQT
jgi:electron transfer flavoprotein alpha subunit